MNAQTTEESYTPFEEVQLNETPLDLNQEQKDQRKIKALKTVINKIITMIYSCNKTVM